VEVLGRTGGSGFLVALGMESQKGNSKDKDKDKDKDNDNGKGVGS
jgi:ribosomal protein S28E/S33